MNLECFIHLYFLMFKTDSVSNTIGIVAKLEKSINLDLPVTTNAQRGQTDSSSNDDIATN